jgi:hypothetical protein
MFLKGITPDEMGNARAEGFLGKPVHRQEERDSSVG